MVKLVGLDAIDPLRDSDYYVQPFQTRSRFADAPARIAAFECFVLHCLDQLEAHPGLTRFGLHVVSKFTFERESAALPKIVVTQEVQRIEEGDVTPLINISEFYASWFPFSGVWDGGFSVNRRDERVSQYLDATARKDHDERRCMVTLLAVEAEESFSAPELVIRTPE